MASSSKPWLSLERRARAICRAQPGYGSSDYRGDPYEAVALQQQAERLRWMNQPDKAPLHVRRSLPFRQLVGRA